MITANTNIGEIARSLTDKAGVLARARAVLIARRKDARRWRKAGLLWPLFGQD
ncbi:hypothetical protein [Novosphingobium sp. MMS21-SN21R]|uniref:hypothetical protein n=1 Tax=Novosphingobium sp. MMS21-SN21R TaxID=2969298 RepID=UPI0028889C2E|nr:hypothetical protein [Novosphingobium sp. MMS21-SN21R]MDT0506803.1 hypothetical protein [Novosphingobium sp. MMS21-SN21R]